jgi:predicted RNA polymerase sigma factor
VIEINRAVAVAMAYGPLAGLDIVDELVGEPALIKVPILASGARQSSVQARPLRRGAPRASLSYRFERA